MFLLFIRYFSGNETAAAQRGYRFTNNPQIQLFNNVDLKFQLAINTAQLSRVFEDRLEDLFIKIDYLLSEI